MSAAMRNTWIDTTPKRSINTMSDFEFKYTETVLQGMTEKEFDEIVKKTLDVFGNPDTVAAIQKIHQIISKQNPNLN